MGSGTCVVASAQIHISAAVFRLKKAASVEMLDEPAQPEGVVSI